MSRKKVSAKHINTTEIRYAFLFCKDLHLDNPTYTAYEVLFYVAARASWGYKIFSAGSGPKKVIKEGTDFYPGHSTAKGILINYLNSQQ